MNQISPPQDEQNFIPKPPIDKGLLSTVCYWLAVGLGSGLAKKAPGTFGTLASLLFLPLLYMVGFWISCAIVIFTSVIGVYICERASHDMGVHDSGHIVWDEWAGQWLACLPLIYLGNTNIVFIIISFVVFRFFDILKPFPIGYLDKKLHGGLGIMLDDIVAGLFTAIVLIILIQYT